MEQKQTKETQLITKLCEEELGNWRYLTKKKTGSKRSIDNQRVILTKKNFTF